MSSAFAPLDQVQAPAEKAPVNDMVVKLSQDTNTIGGQADFLAAKNSITDTASSLLPSFDMSMFAAKDSTAALDKGGEQLSAAPGEAKSVEVKAGDSLWKIAKEDLGGDASNKDILQHVQQIAKLNGMPDPFSAEGSHSESLVLHPGQKLQLSASDSAPAAQVSDSTPAPAAQVSDSSPAPAAQVSDSTPAPAAQVSDSIPASGPTVSDYAPITARDSGPVTIDVHPSLMPMEPVSAPDLQPVAIEAPAATQPAADNVAASTAADTQVKSTAEIGQDWDKAFNARTPGQKGDFSSVDKEVSDLVSSAYKQGGDAAVQSTIDDLNSHIATKNAGVEVIQNGNSYEIHDRMKVQGMFARSADGQDSTIGLYKELGNTVDTVNVGKGSEAVARPQDNTSQVADSGSDAQREEAKSRGSEIGQELKAGASSEKIAEDIQSALKSGNDLSDVVNAANAQTSKMGIGAPHFELRHDRDGNPQLTMKQGLFGGTMLDVNGSDVKVGATLR